MLLGNQNLVSPLSNDSLIAITPNIKKIRTGKKTKMTRKSKKKKQRHITLREDYSTKVTPNQLFLKPVMTVDIERTTRVKRNQCRKRRKRKEVYVILRQVCT